MNRMGKSFVVRGHSRRKKGKNSQVKTHTRSILSYSKHRVFSPLKRRQYADMDYALPDGSFPIADRRDLANAVRSVYRSKNVARAKGHIRKRASALGFSQMLPKGF